MNAAIKFMVFCALVIYTVAAHADPKQQEDNLRQKRMLMPYSYYGMPAMSMYTMPMAYHAPMYPTTALGYGFPEGMW